MKQERRTVCPNKYIIHGNRTEIYTVLKGMFGESLDDEQIKLLYLLELDASQQRVSTDEEVRFWLYNDSQPAAMLLGDTRYSLEVAAISPEIIKKIYEFVSKHNSSNEIRTIEWIQFGYDILSVLYKHLYWMEDYEWCFCFSAMSYLRQNKEKKFMIKHVIDCLHQNQDQSYTCLHIGEENKCTWKSNDDDTCRLNEELAKEIVSKLCKEHVIQETYPQSNYYGFVF